MFHATIEEPMFHACRDLQPRGNPSNSSRRSATAVSPGRLFAIEIQNCIKQEISAGAEEGSGSGGRLLRR
jgi:hypothetical protein